MLSMLHIELLLIRMQKVAAGVMLLIPIVALGASVVMAGRNPDADAFSVRLFPLFVAGVGMGSTIAPLKRYRRLEALFSLSVTPKDIIMGHLLMLGIYCIYILLVYLPIYLTGIAPITEFRTLFLLTLLVLPAGNLACYAVISAKRLHLFDWIKMPIILLGMSSGRYILRIADQPHVWLVLPLSLMAVAITCWMAARLSKEKVILSSE